MTTMGEIMLAEGHMLKSHTGIFEALWSGKKRFEIRLDDRGYRVGDQLNLYEYDPETGEASGRVVRAHVAYILRSQDFHGLADGFVAMSLRDIFKFTLS